MITVLVFGDQLHRGIGAMLDAHPSTHQVLMIEARDKIESQTWHSQRLFFYLSSMRHFAEEVRAAGFHVDYRLSSSMRQGVTEHQREYEPSEIIATEPNSYNARQLCSALGIRLVRSNQFLCHPDEFVEFASKRKSMKMEDFYRWQRLRLGYLMLDGAPVGGQWNFDHDNREPPPKDDHDRWPHPMTTVYDDIDADVLNDITPDSWGAHPQGQWATTRQQALMRLQFFVDSVLPMFGPHEDAMLASNWHLAHSLLSPYLNNGLLLAKEVVDAVQAAFDGGGVPINSAEGFIRQVIGWREYVWNIYWQHMPAYRSMNGLNAKRALPPMFQAGGHTHMRCMSSTLQSVNDFGWAHHIQRLMVLGNFALLAEINPQEFTQWMWTSFIDAAEWVMVPNVVGMSLYADGGIMATKPYASGGAYIDRMSDYCSGCKYDRKKRVGDDACPFTTLYWDFITRHEEQFVKNPRVSRQVYAARKLQDLDEVKKRALEVLALVDEGSI